MAPLIDGKLRAHGRALTRDGRLLNRFCTTVNRNHGMIQSGEHSVGPWPGSVNASVLGINCALGIQTLPKPQLFSSRRHPAKGFVDLSNDILSDQGTCSNGGGTTAN